MVDGDFTLLLPEHPRVFAFLRRMPAEAAIDPDAPRELLVVANLSDDAVDVELPEGWEGSETVLASAPGEATVAARTGMPAQAGSRDQAASRDLTDRRDQAGMPWGHLLPWEARVHRR